MDRIERIRQSFVTRKTEENDTHGYIQRHDPDYHKKNSNHSKPSVENDDLADISVESLIIFLKGLLKNDDSEGAQKKENKPVDQNMRPAINAYNKKPRTIERRYTYLDDDHQDIDINLVQRLIADLEDIMNDGYDHINLVQSDGFLSSIEKTVEKYLSL